MTRSLKLISAIWLLLLVAVQAQPDPPSSSEQEAGFLFRQGLHLLEEGQYARATDLFRRALRKEPERLEIRPYLGRSLYEQGEFEPALRQLELYLDSEPADTKVAFLRVRTLAALERYGQASDALNLLSLSLAKESWEWHNLRGFLEQKLEHPDEAEASFKKALEIAPEALEPAVNLVSLWLTQEKLEEATKLVRDLLARAPEEPQVLNAFAMLLSEKEKGFDPTPLLDKLKEQTLPFELQYNIAAALAERGETDQAAILAADLVDRDPEEARANWLYGRILLQRRELQEAGDYLTAARERLPLNDEIVATMGTYCYLTGDYKQAADWFEQAFKRQPEDGLAAHNLSLALGRMDELKQAIRASRQAYALSQTDSRVVYQLALMLDRDGQWEEAADYYRKYIELIDDPLDVEVVREHLSELEQEE